jgi:monoamine oxidase
MRRRDFIKVVVTGSLASIGCPRSPSPPGGDGGDGAGGSGDGAAGAAGRAGGAPVPIPRTEIHAGCHALRDGAVFRVPRPTRHVPIVIVGGGAAGLAAADALGDLPLVLLEKEPEAGGNATGGAWRGVGFSTGTSYNADPVVRDLAADLGVPLHPIDSVDGLIVNDILVPEFFTRGVVRAPYPQTVRDAFRRFVDTWRGHDVDHELYHLDNLPFAEILKDYPPEVHAFFDSFGPNNWGARVRDTSAYVGIQSAQWLGGLEPDRLTGAEGFGALTRALADRVRSRGAGRIVPGAAVIRVEPDGDRVRVAYVRPGAAAGGAGAAGAMGAAADASDPGGWPVECLSADTVIVAAPKLIAKHLVAGLPEDQRKAMERYRYIPYLVANLCFDGVVYDGSFDVNVPAPDAMSDFVVADWATRRGQGDRNRPTVLSCYMPQLEEDRALYLDEAEIRAAALRAVDRIDRWFPGAADKCREIHVRARGHPMFMGLCGLMTRWGPVSCRPHGPIHFAGSDGAGGVSDLSEAIATGRAAAAMARASLDAAARARRA